MSVDFSRFDVIVSIVVGMPVRLPIVAVMAIMAVVPCVAVVSTMAVLVVCMVIALSGGQAMAIRKIHLTVARAQSHLLPPDGRRLGRRLRLSPHELLHCTSHKNHTQVYQRNV